jgi:hypothetical protein
VTGHDIDIHFYDKTTDKMTLTGYLFWLHVKEGERTITLVETIQCRIGPYHTDDVMGCSGL